jgi:Ca2+-binding RTX toxin-like protein
MALLILVNRRFSTLLADFILALVAFDAILGLSGNGKLSGGTGDDRLEGGAGADILNGDAGNDTPIGDTGADALNDRVSYADTLESGGGFEFSDALALFNGGDSAQDSFPNHAGQVDNFGVEFDNGPDSIGGIEQGIDNLLVRAAQFGMGPTLDTNELIVGSMAVSPQFAYDAGLVEFDPDDAGTDLGPLPIAVFPAALLHAEFLIV